MPIFTVDANIAAGKSSVLKYLHTHYRLPIDLEPVEKWEPFLKDIYHNNKGAFAFQIRVWFDRCWIQEKPNSGLMVMERSPYFQSNVFVHVNAERGVYTPNELSILKDMYATTFKTWSPFGYIYLRSSPAKCAERMARRARGSESTVPLDYLKRLHDLHEAAYMCAIACGLPVVCIDVENKTIPAIAAEVYNAILIFSRKNIPI
jgi:deoxyadenosine/deoxycytidine kinase